MKNFFKFLGIIAMVAVIGFSMTACDDGGGKTDPTVTWPTGLSGTAGQALSSVTIPAHTGTTPGAFSWTNPATVLAEATTAYNMTFTPTDTATYNTVNQNVTITVGPAKTDPTVTWPTGLTGTAGQALSTVTIPAHTGTTPGAFSWTNPATVLAEATTAYNMTFTPTDTATYNTVNQDVTITVNPPSYDPNAGAANIGRIGPGGGIIFYYDEDGFTVQGYGNPGDPGYFAAYTANYLEAAPENATTFTVLWGDHGTLVAGITTNTSSDNISADNHDGNIPFIGQGRRDTMLIVAHMEGKTITYAAAQCAVDYRGPNDLDDWFLPSLSELSLYYYSSVTKQKPSQGAFWSSSQYGNNFAYVMNFLFGDRLFFLKNSTNDVRAIRAF